MNWIRSALLSFVCVLCWVADAPVILGQEGHVRIDWKAELAKAKAGIKKNPMSASWHNQAGVAYDALGDFESAVKEIKLAIKLDPSDSINYYTLYALYKRKGMRSEQRQVLLDALREDPNNPLGHFEFGYILEGEKYWADSLREYQLAKRLAASVEGPRYKDSRGNVYGIDAVRAQVDSAIDRISELSKAATSN
jgi:tetratricopeptide (TPR) repeat protein